MGEVSSELGSTSSGAGPALHGLQKSTAGGRLEIAQSGSRTRLPALQQRQRGFPCP